MPIILLLSILAGFLISCDEDTPPAPPMASMAILNAPDALMANRDSCYLYRVKIEGSVADSVTVEVRAPDGQFHSTFALYDDGGIGSTFPNYACEGSGDIVPNDVIYSRRINGRLLADNSVGEYFMVFRVPGLTEQERTIQVLNVEPCIITMNPQIMEFEMCFSPIPLEVRVMRTPGDAVDSVSLVIESFMMPSYHDTLEFTPVMGDTLWRAMLTPRFFRCVGEGDWQLTYHAYTHFGTHCIQSVSPITYVNSLPVLTNSSLPDTIYRPTESNEIDSISFTVTMNDCELTGESRYYGLKYSVRRRDRNTWIDSTAYIFRDDGLTPDIDAGDGTFTAGLSIPWNIPDSLYYFRFYALECAAPYDTSLFLIDSVQIAPSSGLFKRHYSKFCMAKTPFPLIN